MTNTKNMTNRLADNVYAVDRAIALLRVINGKMDVFQPMIQGLEDVKVTLSEYPIDVGSDQDFTQSEPTTSTVSVPLTIDTRDKGKFSLVTQQPSGDYSVVLLKDTLVRCGERFLDATGYRFSVPQDRMSIVEDDNIVHIDLGGIESVTVERNRTNRKVTSPDLICAIRTQQEKYHPTHTVEEFKGCDATTLDEDKKIER